MVSTTSPNVAAQASKCSMPRDFRPSGSRKRCIGVELDHGVADRRAGGEGDAVAGVALAEVAGFHEQIEGALAAAGLDAGDALHLGRRLQILEEMRLVDEDVIDAQLVEYQPIVLLVFGQQVFQPLLAAGFLLLDRLDDVAAAVRGIGRGAIAEQLGRIP